MPWYLSKVISRELGIPVISKIHTTRITKSRDYMQHGMRSGILTLAASVSHCSLQLAFSSLCVAMDAVSMRMWQTMIPFRQFSLVYPTYAAVYDQRFSETSMNQEVSRRLETLRTRPYILSVIGCRGRNPSVGFEIQALDIVTQIAQQNPEVFVAVVGTSMDDARSAGYTSSIPRNLIFMGRFYSDILLREVYRTALMVVSPVMTTSISNRLNEALFYGKAIISTSTSKRLHPELIHGKNIIISDEYWRYGQIVKDLLANPDSVRDLANSAAESYERYFSSKRCAAGTIEALETLQLR
jgi:hypothetical protein